MKYLFLLLILVSCSSSKTNDSDSSDSEVKEKIQVENKKEIKDLPIDNKDFKIKKSKAYDRSKDFYAPASKTAALEAETQYRVANDNANKDIVTEIVKLCYAKEFDAAFELQRMHYQEYMNHPSFWNQIGTCHLLMKNYRKSLLYYNRAREIEANYAPALNNMGVMFMFQKKPSKALEMFKSAVSSQPFARTPKYNLAQLYLEFGLYQKARPLVSALLNQSPGDKDVIRMNEHLKVME